jgi:precorrin-6B methylase 2
MQSEIPLNFILQKTKQLKNNRQKKRYDIEQSKKNRSAAKIKKVQVSSPKKKKTLTKEDRIKMILTGGKSSPLKKVRSARKKDMYAFYHE